MCMLCLFIIYGQECKCGMVVADHASSPYIMYREGIPARRGVRALSFLFEYRSSMYVAFALQAKDHIFISDLLFFCLQII